MLQITEKCCYFAFLMVLTATGQYAYEREDVPFSTVQFQHYETSL